ncbi:hypothetical protein GCM10027521_22130 [Amycolatopsis cihanbeyliensis]
MVLNGQSPSNADNAQFSTIDTESERAAADSPRAAGVDLAYTQVLAETDIALPPILVHRPTARVTGGTHRLPATSIKEVTAIKVQFFERDEQAAFILALRSSNAHWLPLSLADRENVARRILDARPPVVRPRPPIRTDTRPSARPRADQEQPVHLDSRNCADTHLDKTTRSTGRCQRPRHTDRR